MADGVRNAEPSVGSAFLCESVLFKVCYSKDCMHGRGVRATGNGLYTGAGRVTVWRGMGGSGWATASRYDTDGGMSFFVKQVKDALRSPALGVLKRYLQRAQQLFCIAYCSVRAISFESQYLIEFVSRRRLSSWRIPSPRGDFAACLRSLCDSTVRERLFKMIRKLIADDAFIGAWRR